MRKTHLAQMVILAYGTVYEKVDSFWHFNDCVKWLFSGKTKDTNCYADAKYGTGSSTNAGSNSGSLDYSRYKHSNTRRNCGKNNTKAGND